MRNSIVFLICILLLSGCGSNIVETNNKLGSSVFSKAELSGEESEILDLVGIESDIEIYEYKVDKSYKSITIWLEAYDHGKLISEKFNMRSMIDNENGKIAILVDNSSNYKWKISHKSSKGLSSYSFSTDGDFETNNKYSVSYGTLDNPVEINSSQEIVLKTYLYEDGNGVSVYNNQYYVEEPELLEEYDYVYLLKCQFSKESIND